MTNPRGSTKAQTVRELVKQFDNTRRNRDSCSKTLKFVLQQLVNTLGVPIHSITVRCKSKDSFTRKIRRPDKHYKLLSEVTDLIGLRVTTYFEDDVDRVGEMIRQEFLVDEENSVDKRIAQGTDQFGYRSLHFVVTLSEERCTRKEYAHCAGTKAEIQVRSILQHAWAEIDHDLGYKSQLSVPHYLRRRFSQLSGLLELADWVFVDIRKALNTYAAELKSLIKSDPQSVLVDNISLRTLVEVHPSIGSLDQQICDITGAELVFSDEFIERLVLRFRFSEYHMIFDVLTGWEKYEPALLDFARRWIKEKDYEEFNSGVSLMYLLYLMLANERGVESIEALAGEFSLSKDPADFAARLVPVAQLTTES